MGNLKFADGYFSRLQDYFLSPSCQFIYALAVFFYSRMRRRHLEYFAGKRVHRSSYQCFVHAAGILYRDGCRFQIVAGGSGAEGDGAGIFFFLRHVFIDPLCPFAGAKYQQAGGQRVERTGMAYLRTPSRVRSSRTTEKEVHPNGLSMSNSSPSSYLFIN